MSAVLVLQTQDNSPPGLICDWASARRVSLDVLRVDRWPELPNPASYAFAILLGSDASVARVAPDWVARELKWIARADRAGLPLLGICFGAQALALALGGSVKPLDVPEFSWIEVGEHPEFASGPWLALHEDTITIPDAAAELARNDSGCQAFTIRAHLGVQFHPEVTPAILAAWIAANGERLAHVRAELLADVRTRCQSAAAAAFDLLDGFARRASVAGEPALSAGAYSR